MLEIMANKKRKIKWRKTDTLVIIEGKGEECLYSHQTLRSLDR